MELILGFVLGVAASFLVWYFVAHYFVPSIYFYPELYTLHANDSIIRSEYRVRFRNTGRRDLIDLEFIVKLRVKGLRTEAPFLWRSIYIPVDDARIPMIPPQKKGMRRSVRLLISEIEKKYLDVMPPDIQREIKSGNIGLEGLFDLGTRAELEIYAFCYDAFSGSRKLFRKTYLSSNIVPESTFLQQSC